MVKDVASDVQARNFAENVMSGVTKLPLHSCEVKSNDHHKFTVLSVSAMKLRYGVTSHNSKHIYVFENRHGRKANV